VKLLRAHRALILRAAIAAVLIGGGSSAIAEDAARPATLEDIVVTAQKRSENLQNVPLSVVAYGSETLAETGVQDFSSLAARVPGVTLNSAGPGRSSYSIRGIASTGGNAPTTGFYVDETPILPSGGDGANAGIDPDLFDLARVEVLRGPQGTLYGASSMGGTIKLVTNQPNLRQVEAAVRGEGSTTEHGGGNGRLDAMYNVPLIDDRAALRVVASYKNFSGFIDRQIGVWAPYPGVTPSYPESPAQPSAVIHHVNTEERASLRTTLKFAVNDALTITPSVWIQNLTMGAPSDFDVASGQSSGDLAQRRPFSVSERYTDRSVLSNLTLTYDLGFASLLSTTSYMRREETTPDDQTEGLEIAYPQGMFLPSVYAPIVSTRELTEELRLSFDNKDRRISGTVGAYFNNSNRHYFVNYVVPGYDANFRNTPTSIANFGPGPLDDLNYSQHGDYAPKQYAVFAELNYQLTERLRLTGGLRWYELMYTTERFEDGLSNGGPSVSRGEAKDTGYNPKAELSYQATADRLYYLSAARGVRPGGVNTDNLAQKGCDQDYGPYGPDSLWNYELGTKTRWLDGTLTANAAAYYIRWSNIQQGRTLPCSYQITENAGKAVVHGAELELEARVGGNLTLGFGVGFTQAELAVDAPELNGHSGQQLENVPKWNGNASAKYTFALPAGYSGFARADGQYVGESYPDYDRTDPATFQRSYAVLDLRAGALKDGLEWNLFVANATNKQAYLSKFISDNYDAPSRTRMFTNRPRTIGLSVSYRY
jgi:iron complex outermembrane recepter protein